MRRSQELMHSINSFHIVISSCSLATRTSLTCLSIALAAIPAAPLRHSPTSSPSLTPQTLGSTCSRPTQRSGRCITRYWRLLSPSITECPSCPSPSSSPWHMSLADLNSPLRFAFISHKHLFYLCFSSFPRLSSLSWKEHKSLASLSGTTQVRQHLLTPSSFRCELISLL